MFKNHKFPLIFILHLKETNSNALWCLLTSKVRKAPLISLSLPNTQTGAQLQMHDVCESIAQFFKIPNLED